MSENKGRTIRIFLPDGVPSGLLVLEIMNWTGRVLVAPRSRVTEMLDRPEAAGSGVYILVGEDPEQVGQELVYFGEADDVRKRLYHHQKDDGKEFWNRTIIVTSKDANLTKSHVRYLESRLISLAREAGRATVANGTNPPPPPLPESDVADMEFFLSQVLMVLPVVGFNFAKPRPATEAQPPGAQAGSPELVMEAVGARARAREVDGEFVVFKGSTARKDGIASWDTYRGLRDDLVAAGKLVLSTDPAFYVFADDVAFSSPSAAATVVFAGNQNGRISWRVAATGKTLKEWQEEQMDQAGIAYDSEEQPV
jgi:hypothetical protein